MPARSEAEIIISAQNQTRSEFKQIEQSLRSLESEVRDVQKSSRHMLQTFERTQRSTQGLTRSFSSASRGAGILTTSVGGLGSVLGALGIAAVTHEIGRFGITSIQTAGRLDQLQRALVNIEGSSEKARVRFDQLVQVANRPGLQLEELVQYSNRLSAAGVAAEDIDKILLTVGETVVSLGGSSATSALAMEQLIQSFQLGKVDMRDFRTVIQQIPSLLETLGDVHGVQANIDGLHEAFARTGGSIRDLLIPVFDELSRRFEAPPDDSYIVVMDTLENSFKLFQGAVGDLFLPTVVDAAMAMSEFFEAARAGLKDFDSLPQSIKDIVLGAKDLYDGLLSAAAAIESSVGPEFRELAAALSTLLGGVLDLAGSIYDVLTPVWKLWGQVNATVIALITKLAQDVSSLIGVLTDFVDWVASAWREEDRFTESTQRVTQAIEEVKEAATGASGSFQEYAGSLRTVLEELASVNVEIDEKTNKLENLKSKGLEPTDASVAQIVRRIALLEERSKSLTASLPDLKQELENVNGQLTEKQARLAKMREESQETSASAQQLQRQIANLTALAALLNTQIAQTTTELTETVPAADTATQAIENYSLTLARLKAEAEDARDTLSNTINFEQIGANFQAAIQASDAYYNRQIANAQAALASAEADSDEYFKIETNLFKLQRERAEARKKLTEQASKVGETEAERRVEIAEKEHERLRGAGEETARALEASEKRRTAAAEAEQKRLTEAHEANLKAREEAERASNERIVQNSQEQLSILQNTFENAVPESVDRSYENIQSATVAHYETLKNQARQRITDEDALNAELVSLDRQRNAALEDNHRTYLQRIASDAKNLLGERTDAFKTASDDILHNWERTVSEFERQLREADTEDALRAIEADFETAQQSMLASLQTVLTELGFTAEQAAEIMKEILRTAEGEADGFADKVISAFQRLGKAADRETKQQNRQIERNYRELVSEIEHILSNITDFFIEITRGGDIEDAFKQLGESVAESFLDVFTRDVSENLAASLSSIASETDVAGAAANRGGGAGGAIQAAGGLSSILSLITSPIALAAIIPAAVGAATYYIGDKVGQTGVIDNPNRQGRPLEDNESRRRRGESQSAYERRLQANADAETAEAERQTFFGNYDPRAPFGRAIQETGLFTGNTGYFAEHALRQTDVDIFGRVDLPGLVEDLEGLLQTRVEGLGTDMERAAAALDSATGANLQPALSDYFTATTDFYQTQIDFANFVRRTTGHLEFGDPEALTRQLQQSLNEARTQAPALDSSSRYNAYQRLQQSRQEQANIDEYNALADEQGGVRYGEGVPEPSIEDTVDPELLSRLNVSNLQTAADAAIATFTETLNAPRRTIDSINEAFTTLEPDLRTLYDALFEGIAGEDGIINTAEEQIELNRLGTFDEFTQRYTDLRDDAIAATKQTQQRLATLSKQIATSETLKSFSELAVAPGATIGSITEAWQTTVLPQINALYDQLFAEIAGEDGFINTPEEQIAYLQLGSREDFVTGYESDILTPAVDKMNSIAEALAAIHQDRALSETFENFQDAAVAPGATISGITAHWNDRVVPILRETYNALRADIIGPDGIISAEEGLALAQAGLDISFEDWAGDYEDGILNPAITALNQAAQIIASVTQNRELDAALASFNSAITAPGATVDGITTHWQTHVVPILQETYNFLRSEIIGEDGLISPAEAATLAQRGLDIPLEDWVGTYESDILTPGIAKLNSIASSIATIHQDRRFEGLVNDFNAALQAPGQTVAAMTQWWLTNMTPVLRETYETLRADIIGEDGLISPEELQHLTEAGLDVDFVDWESNFRDDILTPGLQRLATTNTNIGIALQATEQSDVIEQFNAAATAPGATLAGITAFWNTNVSLVLRQTFEGLRNQIIGPDGIVSPEELLQLIQAGLNVPFEDWESTFRDDLLAPATETLAAATEYLESTELQTNVDTLVESFKSAIEAPGATIASLTEQWNTTVVPALRALYQDLYDDIAGPDGIVNTATERADLLKLGTEDDFVSSFATDVFHPLVGQLQSRQTRTRSALGQNAISRAQFDLGNANSETDFEARRDNLITAINAYYDAEEERIEELKLTEGELKDLRQDTQLAREQALQQAETATNQFAELRIRTEMQVADEIQDLRDRELDNEADRQQAITELHEDSARRREEIEEDHQDRLRDIQLRFLRSREDIDREFGRDIEDILRDAGADTLLSPAELERFLRTAQSPDATGLASEASRLGANLSEDDISQIQGLARERLRDFENIDTTAERARSDAQHRVETARAEETARSEIRRQEIQDNATATADALQTALQPLLEQQAGLSTHTIQQQEQTASLESQTAQTDSENASNFTRSIDSLDTVAQSLNDSDIPSAINLVRESAAASLKISSAIQSLPGLLESSFERIFDDLQKTIVDILQIEAGIQGGVSQFLLDTLIESEGSATGIVGETAAAALRSLGINPDQFLPPEATATQATTETATAIEQLANIETPIPVEVTNSDEIYDPKRIAELQGEGYNNREIGQILREAAEPILTPITDTILGAEQTTPIQTPTEPNALQAAAGGGGAIPVTVTNIGDLAGAVSSGGNGGSSVINLNATLELDGDVVTEKVENNIVSRRAEGRSLI